MNKDNLKSLYVFTTDKKAALIKKIEHTKIYLIHQITYLTIFSKFIQLGLPITTKKSQLSFFFFFFFGKIKILFEQNKNIIVHNYINFSALVNRYKHVIYVKMLYTKIYKIS